MRQSVGKLIKQLNSEVKALNEDYKENIDATVSVHENYMNKKRTNKERKNVYMENENKQSNKQKRHRSEPSKMNE